MSKGDCGKILPPETTQTPKKSPDSKKSIQKDAASQRQPISQELPKIHPGLQEITSKKEKVMDRLSKQHFGKYLNISFLNNLLRQIKGEGKPPAAMGDSAKPFDRTMKYPYTFAAKIAQFPYKFHINNGWLYKYYLIAVVVATPLFYKIGKLSYSPENVRVWEEKRREMYTTGGHH